MIIHFVCRGNAFRSIIAEAYLNSKELPDVSALSSGTVASTHKEQNHPTYPKTLALLGRHGIAAFAKDHYADDVTQELLDMSDVAIFMNERAYQEAVGRLVVPSMTRVWDVTDIGEPGRVPHDAHERAQYMEDVYSELVANVDGLLQEFGLDT